MKSIFSIILCLTAFALQAQTYYYAHTKTVYADGRVVEQNGESGQFVCRTSADGPKRCFDSTSSGRNHLNGNLFYVGNNNGNEVYHGKSYFGENTYYQFNDNRGLLNIKDARGNVYVYKRRNAPAGRTRSSLIISGGAPDGWDARDHWVDTTLPVDGSSSDDDTSRKQKTTNSRSSSRDCGYCHGGGRVRAHIGTGSYGVKNRYKKCPTCGVRYDVATDHWHECPHCHGTGRK